ncbi:glycosyl transferase [Capsulimonas corticalis]|uniref:Glycosyl transferase n=1 Tax=Capsulimonas corticalis TaxID=2219043 RepID=A0A402CP64_9BACT|nr:glycosyltransferase family 4 protein [Capsulimonas corticalis]BDI33111.1 glycosyl transferase [Capsulimonas corticalis]
MNILLIADAVFEDKPGGSRTAAKELARCLVKRGHGVVLLVNQVIEGKPYEEQLWNGVTVVRAPRSKAGVAGMRRACEDIVKRFGPFDIAHIHFAYAGVGPLWSSALRGVPTVRTFHGPWCEEGWVEDTSKARGGLGIAKARAKRTARHWVEQDSLRRAESIISLSAFMSGILTDHFDVKSERIARIDGGVDVERFHVPKDTHALRERLGLPVDRPIALTVRRLAARMGLENLVRSMPAVLREVPDLYLVIAGKGPERARLEQLSKDLCVDGSIHFAGFVPDEDLAGLYGAADLFVLPTTALEGFGLVIVESLACGTPVIGAPVGAIPELLAPLEPKLLAREASSEAIGEAIIEFFKTDWGDRLTADVVRRYVLSRYTWDMAADQTIDLYDRFAAKKGTNGNRITV